MMKPEDSLDWLYRRQRLGMTLGLERTYALLEHLGHPQDAFSTVLVGGTNGKGSCARALAACLSAAGRRTGLYTSPHLSRIGERYLIDGEETTREAVAGAVARVRDEAERLGASFFEVLTVAACLLFGESGVETAVMEVGLGGRFDATNALTPRLSIVTGVARDHIELLGDDPVAIAGEKAGIFRPGRLALTAATGDALHALRSRARQVGAPLWTVGEEIRFDGRTLGWDGIELEVLCPEGKAAGHSPLVGAHQLANLALAVAAALELQVPSETIARGLAAARWPGRLERLFVSGRWVVFDGAHNAQSAQALALALTELQAAPLTLVAGMGRDKDLAAFADSLRPLTARAFATRASYSPRARDPHEVARSLGAGAVAVEDPQEALDRALLETGEGGTVLVAGSLYLVGELRPRLVGEEFEAQERWQ